MKTGSATPRAVWPSIVAALVVVAAWPPAIARGQGTRDQRAVLMELYDATGGPQWKVRRGWGTDAPVCQWIGVDCMFSPDSGSVARLTLPDNDLRGTLPASLASLPWLTTLDVSRNPLRGAVPPALVDKANQNQLDLRTAGSTLDDALTAVTVQVDRDLGVCSGDVATRMVVDLSQRQAAIEAVRCQPDGKTGRPVTCLRATTDAPDVALVARALRRLGLVSASVPRRRPGGVVVDHEVRYTATYTWGNGDTGRLASQDDVGPLDVLIAQSLLVDLVPRGWDRDATPVPCEAFAWRR